MPIKYDATDGGEMKNLGQNLLIPIGEVRLMLYALRHRTRRRSMDEKELALRQ